MKDCNPQNSKHLVASILNRRALQIITKENHPRLIEVVEDSTIEDVYFSKDIEAGVIYALNYLFNVTPAFIDKYKDYIKPYSYLVLLAYDIEEKYLKKDMLYDYKERRKERLPAILTKLVELLLSLTKEDTAKLLELYYESANSIPYLGTPSDLLKIIAEDGFEYINYLYSVVALDEEQTKIMTKYLFNNISIRKSITAC